MTAADWTAQNPVLPQFQIGIEVNAATGAYGRMKMGDGQTAWNDLNYLDAGGVKVYRALLTQSGTDAPVATVLENTLGGTVAWSRLDTGKFDGTLVGAFPADKTSNGTGFVPNTSDAWALGGGSFVYARVDDDTIRLATYSDLTGTQADAVLAVPTYIEILVYP